MIESPLTAGAVHETVTTPDTEAAEVGAGVLGALKGFTAGRGVVPPEEDPALFLAVTVNVQLFPLIRVPATLEDNPEINDLERFCCCAVTDTVTGNSENPVVVLLGVIV